MLFFFSFNLLGLNIVIFLRKTFWILLKLLKIIFVPTQVRYYSLWRLVIRLNFIVKKHLGGLREEIVYKMSLVSTPERCETILTDF